jgi:predicted acyltransferase
MKHKFSSEKLSIFNTLQTLPYLNLTMTQPTPRIASIDILRALIMVLMIFVNDLWSLTNIPLWLEHTEANEDGMGLADIVFPAFLFIVGMSLPFAIRARIKKGASTFNLILHITLRSLALIIMGLFLVNGESINEEATGVSRLVWNVLSCFAFVLIWNSYPSSWNAILTKVLKVAGILILVVLAFNYWGGDTEMYRFTTHWWGILGLIGWSYLVSATLLVLTQSNLWSAIFLCLAFHVVCMIQQTQLVTSDFFNAIIGPLQNGGSPALTLGGAVVSLLYLQFREHENGNRKLMITCFAITIVLLLTGFVTNQFWIISKILATPPWILLCSGITIIIFLIVFYLADVLKKDNIFNLIKPAGTNTLTCYLLPYFIYALVAVSGIEFPEIMLTGVVGLIKSFLFAILVTVIAGWCERINIQLKL